MYITFCTEDYRVFVFVCFGGTKFHGQTNRKIRNICETKYLRKLEPWKYLKFKISLVLSILFFHNFSTCLL